MIENPPYDVRTWPKSEPSKPPTLPSLNGAQTWAQ